MILELLQPHCVNEIAFFVVRSLFTQCCFHHGLLGVIVFLSLLEQFSLLFGLDLQCANVYRSGYISTIPICR